MESDVLFSVIRDSGPYGLDVIEDAILEHEDIQAMFHQLDPLSSMSVRTISHPHQHMAPPTR